ncbi:hypothetical protein PpBr36_07303 [Pyricularia pennisetigena]|uniref:hypothetical protein n=1 Tax=Pyricularia pennisetigena TaxID=1578925 RepID=UPI001151F24C|nr:hypothetical protein PpBr36_07303 [Pyricularia pennisetigena]TLS25583.1 hypothetical protein PpBr36_07303 [Pyricularia pennisetigena]
MISSRIASISFMAAATISSVDAYPTAQAIDPNAAGLAAPPIPGTGGSTPTVPATATATKGIVNPTLMPGTYLSTGGILGIATGVLALLVVTTVLCAFAYRHTQTITKVALLRRRARDKARVKASRHKTRRSGRGGNRSRTARPVRDVEAALDVEDQPAAARGRARWSRRYEPADLAAPGSVVVPAARVARDGSASPTGLTQLREISPGASAQGENRNSRTVPIPRGTRSNSVSTTATSTNDVRDIRKLSRAHMG